MWWQQGSPCHSMGMMVRQQQAWGDENTHQIDGQMLYTAQLPTSALQVSQFKWGSEEVEGAADKSFQTFQWG